MLHICLFNQNKSSQYCTGNTSLKNVPSSSSTLSNSPDTRPYVAGLLSAYSEMEGSPNHSRAQKVARLSPLASNTSQSHIPAET